MKFHFQQLTAPRAILIAILIAATVVRFIGLIPGHNPNHPDEPMSYSSAMTMITNNDLNPRRFDYPAGVPLLHYVVYKTYILPVVFFFRYVLHPRALPSILLHAGTFVSEHTNEIFGKGDLDALFWSRIINALLATASVYLVYGIGKKLYNPLSGLAAAFFLTFNYRHVLSSHLALSDIPNSFFALFAFFASLLLLEKNTRNRYLFCGFCIGLSISMKYQIFSILPFLFIHSIWTMKKKKLHYLFHKDFIMSIIIIIFIVISTNIYFFLNFQSAMAQATAVSLRYGAGALRLNIYPLVYLYYWGIGPGPSIAIIIGFFLSLITFPFQTLLLLTYVGPFLYVFLYYMTGGVYVRNFTTVIPFLMFFAGCGFALIVTKMRHWFSIHVITLGAIALLFVINWHSIKDSLVLSKSYTGPWNRQILQEWADDHLPNNSKILNANVGVPSIIEKSFIVTPWEHKEVNAVSEMEEAGYDFAILNTDWYQIYLFWFGLPFPTIMHGIPFHALRESYYGLAIQEFLRYTIYEIYKPWQAPDNNYLVIKIPKKPSTLGKKMQTYYFDNNLEGWQFDEAKWNRKDGHEELGSLELAGKRVISPFISITPGKLYIVEGFAKPSEEIKSNLRDGFFRVDFYEKNDTSLLDHGGMYPSVSGRVFGSSQWMKERVVVQAPPGANFLTISFQRENLDLHYWIDDVVLYESDEMLYDRFPDLPYIKPTIPQTTLFPSSIY